jgi:hypothetical protein
MKPVHEVVLVPCILVNLLAMHVCDFYCGVMFYNLLTPTLLADTVSIC